MSEFPCYEAMRTAGSSPEEVYRTAKAEGLGFIALIRMVRQTFGLSFAEAKEVSLRADGVADSLESHQERLVPIVEQFLQMKAGASVASGANSQEGDLNGKATHASAEERRTPQT